MMDINDLRSLSTVFVALALAGVCWWAFSPSRKKRFEEAAQLPFADELSETARQQEHETKHKPKKDENIEP